VQIHVEEDFSGDIAGSGVATFLQTSISDAEASFVGVERVTGTVGGRSGTFVFQDHGTLKDGTVSGTLVRRSRFRNGRAHRPSRRRRLRRRGRPRRHHHARLLVRMSGELDREVATATGAATGIGKTIATTLATAGARVVVSYRTKPEAAAVVVEEITDAGGDAIAVAADVGRAAEYDALVTEAIDHYGRWDVLVNNAGIALVKPFSEITEEEFDTSFAANVKGVFNGCQLALARMADGGRVINISSSTTGLMLPGYGVYDATKGAIETMSHVISKDFGPRGITVNVTSPGATETETYRNGENPEFLAELERMSAFGRLGQPEEIAAVVAFLASDNARWVTAQNIRVNGGTV
jgi:3-oxoacyl-[acyl-carrier protein] reductase